MGLGKTITNYFISRREELKEDNKSSIVAPNITFI